MIENKLTEILKLNTSDRKRNDRDSLHFGDSKIRKPREIMPFQNPSCSPKFKQNEYQSLFEKSITDLFLNVDENIELNLILSKLARKTQKSNTQKFQEKLEISFKNSLKKNTIQRTSIKKFMQLLIGDFVGILHKKDVK